MNSEEDIKNEITKICDAVGIREIQICTIVFTAKSFGDFSVEVKHKKEKFRIVKDRTQYFLELWLDEETKFIDVTEMYPELRDVCSLRIDEESIGNISLHELLEKWVKISNSQNM
ncbi:MAG: hypothetical protein ACPGVT_10500 [Maricaulaceae bacterium]